MGFLSSLFGMDNPADSARPYLDELEPTIKPYYEPYVNMGRETLPQYQNQINQALGLYPALSNQYSQMTGLYPQLQSHYTNMMGYGPQLGAQYSQLATHPEYMLQQLGNSYQSSPGYQFALKEALAAAGNAAAAGGMSGTPLHQRNAMETAQGLAARDYNDYLSNALGLYGAGLSGMQSLYGTGLSGTQGMYGTGLQGQQALYGSGLSGLGNMVGMGYGASQDLAANLANAQLSNANLAYAGQANQNQGSGQMLGGLLGMGANLFF